MKRRLLILFAAVAVLAAACGDDDDDSASDTTSGATAAATTGGTVAAPSPTAASTSSTKPVEQFDPKGVVIYGASLAGGAASGRLQPDVSTSICDFGLMDPIYSTLIHRNGTTGNLEPELAEKWEAPDASTFRMTLRSGLKFTDGTTLDAAAVVAALNKTRTSTVSSVSAGLAQIDTVTAIDASNVEIKFKTPVAGTFAFTLAGREGMVSAAASTDTAPVGAGPFKFISQTPGDNVVYEKNPGYWNAAAIRLAGLKFQNVEAGPPTTNALLAGDIDMYLGSPDTNPQVEANSSFAITRQPGGAYHKLNIKLDAPPLDNLAFRQAMNYAIDRPAIVQTLFRGAAEVAWQPYNSTFFGHDPTADNLYPHDVAKAKAKLTEAGFPNGTELEFFYPGNNATFQRLADLVVAQLGEAGIKLNLRPSTDIVREYLTEHQLPGTITLWPPRPDPSVTIFAQWGPNQLQNTGNYNDPTLNQLISDVRSTTDLAKQETAYKAMAKHVATNALDVPIAFAELSAPHTKKVIGEVEQYENCQAVNFRTLAKAPA